MLKLGTLGYEFVMDATGFAEGRKRVAREMQLAERQATNALQTLEDRAKTASIRVAQVNKEVANSNKLADLSAKRAADSAANQQATVLRYAAQKNQADARVQAAEKRRADAKKKSDAEYLSAIQKGITDQGKLNRIVQDGARAQTKALKDIIQSKNALTKATDTLAAAELERERLNQVSATADNRRKLTEEKNLTRVAATQLRADKAKATYELRNGEQTQRLADIQARGIQRLEGRYRTHLGIMRQTGEEISRIGNRFLIVFGVMVAALAAVGKAGVEMNNTILQTSIALTQMSGSGVVAQQMLTDLRKEAITSLLTFKEMVPLAQRLAQGFGPTGLGRVIPTIRAFGDAAAMTGATPDQQQRAFKGVQNLLTRGNISQRYVQQIAGGLGVNVNRFLLQAFGTTNTQTLKGMHKTGADIANAIVDGMEKEFGGAQARISRTTIPGLLSMFKDSFTDFASTVTGSLFRSIILSMQKLNDSFRRLAQNQSGLDAISLPFTIMGKTILALSTVVSKFMDVFAKLPPGLQSFIAIVGVTALALTGLAGITLKIVGGMIQFAANVGLMALALRRFNPAMFALVTQMNTVPKALALMRTGITGLLPVLGTWAAAIGAIAAAWLLVYSTYDRVKRQQEERMSIATGGGDIIPALVAARQTALTPGSHQVPPEVRRILEQQARSQFGSSDLSKLTREQFATIGQGLNANIARIQKSRLGKTGDKAVSEEDQAAMDAHIQKMADFQSELAQAEIDAMKDGLKKKLAQIALNAKEQRAKNLGVAQELIEGGTPEATANAMANRANRLLGLSAGTARQSAIQSFYKDRAEQADRIRQIQLDSAEKAASKGPKSVAQLQRLGSIAVAKDILSERGDLRKLHDEEDFSPAEEAAIIRQHHANRMDLLQTMRQEVAELKVLQQQHKQDLSLQRAEIQANRMKEGPGRIAAQSRNRITAEMYRTQRSIRQMQKEGAGEDEIKGAWESFESFKTQEEADAARNKQEFLTKQYVTARERAIRAAIDSLQAQADAGKKAKNLSGYQSAFEAAKGIAGQQKELRYLGLTPEERSDIQKHAPGNLGPTIQREYQDSLTAAQEQLTNQIDEVNKLGEAAMQKWRTGVEKALDTEMDVFNKVNKNADETKPEFLRRRAAAFGAIADRAEGAKPDAATMAKLRSLGFNDAQIGELIKGGGTSPDFVARLRAQVTSDTEGATAADQASFFKKESRRIERIPRNFNGDVDKDKAAPINAQIAAYEELLKQGEKLSTQQKDEINDRIQALKDESEARKDQFDDERRQYVEQRQDAYQTFLAERNAGNIRRGGGPFFDRKEAELRAQNYLEAQRLRADANKQREDDKKYGYDGSTMTNAMDKQAEALMRPRSIWKRFAEEGKDRFGDIVDSFAEAVGKMKSEGGSLKSWWHNLWGEAVSWFTTFVVRQAINGLSSIMGMKQRVATGGGIGAGGGGVGGILAGVGQLLGGGGGGGLTPDLSGGQTTGSLPAFADIVGGANPFAAAGGAGGTGGAITNVAATATAFAKGGILGGKGILGRLFGKLGLGSLGKIVPWLGLAAFAPTLIKSVGGFFKKLFGHKKHHDNRVGMVFDDPVNDFSARGAGEAMAAQLAVRQNDVRSGRDLTSHFMKGLTQGMVSMARSGVGRSAFLQTALMHSPQGQQMVASMGGYHGEPGVVSGMAGGSGGGVTIINNNPMFMNRQMVDYQAEVMDRSIAEKAQFRFGRGPFAGRDRSG